MSSPIEEVTRHCAALREALSQAVVGQEEAKEEIIAAWLAGGHILLEGVPGVAKTLLARALSAALGLSWGRVQFTPDLMPADVTGSQLFDFRERVFHLQRGPIFCQVLLGDEINRAPPKTQSALLEAMAERQVTIDGTAYPLDPLFFVVATQNPLEHEGTYPLPEAQLDRFLLKVQVGYPAEEAELEIYRRFLDGRLEVGQHQLQVSPVMTAADLPALRQAIAGVHVDERLLGYLRALLQATRSSPLLRHGASPRAGMGLLAVARARAAMEGRAFAIPDDIKRMAGPTLRHRLSTTPEADLDGLRVENVLDGILAQVPAPR